MEIFSLQRITIKHSHNQHMRQEAERTCDKRSAPIIFRLDTNPQYINGEATEAQKASVVAQEEAEQKAQHVIKPRRKTPV